MVSIDHPDGGSISLPASETSLEPLSVNPQSVKQLRLFEPRRLLQLLQKFACQSSPPEVKSDILSASAAADTK